GGERAEPEGYTETGSPSVVCRPAARDGDDRAAAESVPRLRRHFAAVGRGCVGGAGICAGAVQSDPHGAAEAELRGLLSDRAGSGAESGDRSWLGWAAGACAGSKVRGPPAAVPASREVSTRKR